MKYDPIKKSLGNIFNKLTFLRKIFYKLLDLLLLRTWHIKREIRRWKHNINKKNINVLDAGAGFGQYTYFLSNLSKQLNITAVDIKQEQIDDCNIYFQKIGKDKQVNFQYADLTELNLPERFDMILSVDVMEHILEDVKVFKNFYNIMTPNAMLLISTPSDMSQDHDHDEEQHNLPDKNFFVDEHVRDGYNINDLIEKLKTAGFSKIEAKYSYGKPGKISWILSMKIPITLLNLSKIFFIFLPIYFLITYPVCFILNFLDVRVTHKKGTGLIVKAYK